MTHLPITNDLLKPIEGWWHRFTEALVQTEYQTEYQTDIRLDEHQVAQRILLTVLWLWLAEARSPLLQRGQPLYPQLLNGWRSCSVLGQLGLAQPTVPPEQEPLLAALLQILDQCDQSSLTEGVLGQVYEQSLSWQERRYDDSHPSSSFRKASGVYYTPPAIIRYIVHHTVERLLDHHFRAHRLPGSLSILDPACGGGAFLLSSYQTLLDGYLRHYIALAAGLPETEHDRLPITQCSGQWRLTPAARTHLLSYLYGVDVDPTAVTVTQLSLWLKWLRDSDRWPDSCDRFTELPDLSGNIQWGNALIEGDLDAEGDHASKGSFNSTSVKAATGKDHSRIQSWEWRSAFPTVFQAGGFDAVIGNPPYVDAETMMRHCPEWRSYCARRYRTATGNWDLFCVFIEKAIELCKPQGLNSFVVPNKLTAAEYARPVRRILAHENRLFSLRDYAQVPVFAASVYPLVYVVQRSRPTQSPVVWEQMRDLDHIQQRGSLHLSRINHEAPWISVAHAQQGELLARLQQLPTLDQVAHVNGSATVAEAYALQPLMVDCPHVGAGDLRVVNSGTIDRYCLLWGQKPLRYLGQVYQYPVIPTAVQDGLPSKRYQQARTAKLIVAGMTQQLECALDSTGNILAGKSTTIICAHPSPIDLRYLLGILNSQLMTYYVRNCFSGNQLRGGYLRIGPPQLRQLPIYIPQWDDPNDCGLYEQIITLVDRRCALSRPALTNYPQCQDLEAAIHQRVCQMYRLTNADIQCL